MKLLTGKIIHDAIVSLNSYGEDAWDYNDLAALLNSQLSEYRTQPLDEEPALTMQEAAAINAVEES